MNDLKMKFIRFMQGRYGDDNLNRFLFKFFIILFILSLFGIRIARGLSTVVTIIYIFRFFSKNYNVRYQENQMYLKYTEKFRWRYNSFKKDMAYRKTHKIFKCRSCGKKLSVPKGKGTIEVSCPCGNKVRKKT